jgi:hypothetical protein
VWSLVAAKGGQRASSGGGSKFGVVAAMLQGKKFERWSERVRMTDRGRKGRNDGDCSRIRWGIHKSGGGSEVLRRAIRAA